MWNYTDNELTNISVTLDVYTDGNIYTNAPAFDIIGYGGLEGVFFASHSIAEIQVKLKEGLAEGKYLT